VKIISEKVEEKSELLWMLVEVCRRYFIQAFDNWTKELVKEKFAKKEFLT
jgi:hypothetical protein